MCSSDLGTVVLDLAQGILQFAFTTDCIHLPGLTMGWFSRSSDDSGVKKTSGGAFESPSRSNRKQCYAARDAFFECLDKNNVLDSINTKKGRDKAASFCEKFDQEFEKNCAHSWVEYFKKQRVVNYQREQTIKKIEQQGGEIVAPQLPLPSSK